jgi:ferrous iron transport protein B
MPQEHERVKRIALVGNPNSGKTSLFNRLTGLSQKVGNYPGVTVEKRSGRFTLPGGETAELIDLPGAYSLSSTSPDELVVQNILLDPQHENYPDALVLVLDVTNLLRNLFFASQIVDLGIPVVIALNMMDLLRKNKQEVDMHALSTHFGVPVLGISARNGLGVNELCVQLATNLKPSPVRFIDPAPLAGETLEAVLIDFPHLNPYNAFKVLNTYASLPATGRRMKLEKIVHEHHYNTHRAELLEINERYGLMETVVRDVLLNQKKLRQQVYSERIDSLVTHPVWGFFIFLLVFFSLFQSVFLFAQWPMNWIDQGMVQFGAWVGEQLSPGWGTDMLVDGVIPGLSGVLVFLPQIMILFGLISLLEDSGYLSRVSFMTDGLLRRFGMNGKSIVPLVGGFACAVPSIMAAKGIENRRERLITIFITPLMSCSARLPVYVFLVAFIVPDRMLAGVFSLQALFMTGLYLLGVVFSLLVAMVLNRFLKKDGKGTFILELPDYKWPNLKNAGITVLNKGKTFVLQAGKIILIASLVLWVLGYLGPQEKRAQIRDRYAMAMEQQPEQEDELGRQRDSELLEHSYLGYIGKSIEPAIAPLGFDWKIGIALVNSFAAREVFVGTMATIYSVQEDTESPKGLKAIVFPMPVAASLLIFYVFALQCLSTVAVVRQETGGWKWPAVQFLAFTGLAYILSLITFQVLR